MQNTWRRSFGRGVAAALTALLLPVTMTLTGAAAHPVPVAPRAGHAAHHPAGTPLGPRLPALVNPVAQNRFVYHLANSLPASRAAAHGNQGKRQSLFGRVVKLTAHTIEVRPVNFPVRLSHGRLVYETVPQLGGTAKHLVTLAVTRQTRTSGRIADGATVFIGASVARSHATANVIVNLAGGHLVHHPGGIRPTHTVFRRNLIRKETGALCANPSNENPVLYLAPNNQIVDFEGCIGGPSYTGTMQFNNVEIFTVGLITIDLDSASATYAAGGFSFDIPVDFDAAYMTGHQIIMGNPEGNSELALSITPESPGASNYLLSGGAGVNLSLTFTVNVFLGGSYNPTANIGIFSGISQGTGAAPLGSQSVTIPATECPSVGVDIPDTPLNAIGVSACFPIVINGSAFSASLTPQNVVVYNDQSSSTTPISAVSFSNDSPQIIYVDPSQTVFGLTFSNFSYDPDMDDEITFGFVVGDRTVYTTPPATYYSGSQPLICTGFPACPGASIGLSGSEPASVTLQLFAGPSLTGLVPDRGPNAGGGTVILSGDGFENASGVPDIESVAFEYGTDSSVPASYTVLSTNQIQITIPPSPYPGPSSMTYGYIQVETTNGYKTDGENWYWLPPPSVTYVQGNWSTTTGGQQITIAGNWLTNANEVLFGNTPATNFTIEGNGADDAQIVATAPPHAPGSVHISVSVKCGYALPTYACGTSAPSSATVQYLGAPTITGLSLVNGPWGGGPTELIDGTGLNSVNVVDFIQKGPHPTTLPVPVTKVINDQQIAVSLPPLTPGPYEVVVDAGCDSSSPVLYPTDATACGLSAVTPASMYQSLPPPWIFSVSPNSGSVSGGTLVTVKGFGFTTANRVTVGGVSAHFTVLNDSTLQFTAPPGAAGDPQVLITTGCDTLATTDATSCGSSQTGDAQSQYSYVDTLPLPTVTSVSPASGPGGTPVTISGTGFTTASGVDFGTTPATAFKVLSDSEITATAPTGSGTVNVTVTTACGTEATTQATSCGVSPTRSGDQFAYVPYGQTPEVPWAAGLPLLGLVVGGVFVRRRRAIGRDH